MSKPIPDILYYKNNIVQDMINTPVTLTTSWANLGPLICTSDVPAIAIWIKYLLNDSLGMQLRVVARRYQEDTEYYSLPIKSVNPTFVQVSPEYFKLPDVDTDVVVPIECSDLVKYLQFQVRVGTLGETAASITKCQLTTATTGRTI